MEEGEVVRGLAVAAILWELGEYIAFIRDSEELDTAYTDTLGDMMLGLDGATVAGILSATVLAGPRGQTRATEPLPPTSGSQRRR